MATLTCVDTAPPLRYHRKMRTTATEDDGASGLLEAVHAIRAGHPPSWVAWVAARPRLRGNPVLAQEAARQDRRGCLRVMWPDLDASARTGALLAALDAHQATAARWMLAHWMGPWPLEAFVAAARAGSWPLARRVARASPDAMNATLFAEAVSAAPHDVQVRLLRRHRQSAARWIATAEHLFDGLQRTDSPSAHAALVWLATHRPEAVVGWLNAYAWRAESDAVAARLDGLLAGHLTIAPGLSSAWRARLPRTWTHITYARRVRLAPTRLKVTGAGPSAPLAVKRKALHRAAATPPPRQRST